MNEPFPVTWDQLRLPPLAKPWTLGGDESVGSEVITVRRDGSAVGYVRLYVSQAGTFTTVDLVGGGFEALWKLATDNLAEFVASSWEGSPAEPETVREVSVAGGRGVRTAFRVVSASTGETHSRIVWIHHWDGRGLWMFMLRWPPVEELVDGFDKLSDQEAFDPQFEALVAGLRLPEVLPTPNPGS